ncbi:hypothetical protein [Tetragenococcus halophilus]|uniref:hypothetical protein n=1 Tax=Tetragenococcus halophilus TaxID=51669 RepID=UPI000CA9FC32|nr:hypothetical protein [Tetragenococcus halophilus]MCO7027208.1 hypothetical protein [Tetragenococcus halophilus]MCO8292456.1 hypothetical protein [Tetragenococcus halophilus]WJS82292.1 hypothetical protein KFZ55_01620 [Tetragenococcus halophilus]GBD72135.1 hypothetical protein TEHN7125_0295 [Tetragenococcus halophilus subsp. halophilus]GBD74591.1 hypothetical protein TEHN7126_0290 [Tetragenococcus halophilus subsp. halophilus]
MKKIILSLLFIPIFFLVACNNEDTTPANTSSSSSISHSNVSDTGSSQIETTDETSTTNSPEQTFQQLDEIVGVWTNKEEEQTFAVTNRDYMKEDKKYVITGVDLNKEEEKVNMSFPGILNYLLKNMGNQRPSTHSLSCMIMITSKIPSVLLSPFNVKVIANKLTI